MHTILLACYRDAECSAVNRRDGLIADWAAQHSAEEIDRMLNDAHVLCGPIYTIADIVNDPQFKARDMLIPHHDPEFGEHIGPGVVAKLHEEGAV